MTEQPQATLTRDEGQLVSEAKAGNYVAFEELVNRYEKKIYRLGMNITGNREDAEDVLQDAFLKAFEHLPDFREDSRFYTWIVRIAVNEALMKLRKRRTSREVPMDDSEDDNGEVVVREFADWKPNPEQQYAKAELKRILDGRVSQLVDEGLHHPGDGVAAGRPQRPCRHSERHEGGLELEVRHEVGRELAVGKAGAVGGMFALTEGHEVVLPRDQSAGRVDTALEKVETSGPVEVVLQVVLSRPEQLYGDRKSVV